MNGKKTSILIIAISVIVILSIGAAVYFSSSSSTKKTEVSTNKEDPEGFGYQALKINGKFVSQDIFTEERNKFFEKWSRNAEMLYKTDEERNDMLLDEVIKRVIIEDFINNKADVQVTKVEVDDYIKKYIDLAYASQGGLKAYMEGMGFKSEEEVYKNTEFYLKRLKYFSSIANKYGVSISDSEFNEKFTKHKQDSTLASGKRIHISAKERGDAEALKIANDIYTRLKNGEDFAAVAKEKSEDEESKSTGGSMQNITGGIYSKEFDQAVFNASPGTLIPPVKNMSGYDIVYLEKIVTSYHRENEYKNILLMQKFGESDKLNTWLEEVKKSIPIEIIDPSFKAYRQFKSNDLKGASVSYKQAYDKTKFELFLQKASECYKKLGDWDKVIEMNDIGLDVSPENVEYSINKAEGLYKKQQTDDAKSLMKKAEKKAGDNVYYKQLISQMYTNLGLKEDADRIQKEINSK
ncbi:MAG TPA: peptidylprolyl isomerase [Pseudobacteroides sp.]|uniref:peptidylprolyl isomerase n=1 Tax=Pseudobacteroides sp. TaxID=1968840 RepID=UPI002F9277A7